MTGKISKILPAVLFLTLMVSGAALTVRAASLVPGTEVEEYRRKETGKDGQEDRTGGEDPESASSGIEDTGEKSGYEKNPDGGYEVLPDWIIWQEREIHNLFSWNDPSAPAEADEPCLIRLSARRVTVESGEGIFFETPDTLWVQDVLVSDVDKDGQRELVMLCWRQGHYDRARPFWIKEADQSIRQHIYIYDWKEDGFRPKWMASDILIDVADWEIDTMNLFHLTEPDGTESRWVWDSWGLTCVNESLNSNRLTFAAVGDNLIHIELVGEANLRGGFDYMYDGIRDRIKDVDVSIINQETPLVSDLSRVASYPCFGTPYMVGTAVRDAGFDVASCATNHALDQGLHGVRATSSYFEENDILYPGIQTVDETAYIPFRLLEKHGIKTAFLGYTQMTNGYPLPEGYPYAVHLLDDEAAVRADLRAAREAADLVVVCAHWGTEYQYNPDSFQQYWCNVFLSEGVDVVIGTHPHVLQPYGIRTRADGHEMLVYYSLGNFISAQNDPARVLGGYASFTVIKDTDGVHIESYDLEPLITHSEPGARTTYFLSDYSEELAARHPVGITMEGEWALFRMSTFPGDLFD